MVATVTGATASRNQLGNPCCLIGRSATLVAVAPRSIITTLKPTNRLGSDQLWLPRKVLGSGAKARMVHLTRVPEGRGRGARATITNPLSRTGQNPWPLKICRSMIDIIGRRRLRHQAVALSTFSHRNPLLLITTPLSVCRLQKAVGMHTYPMQNQDERVVVHPPQLSAPHPPKSDGKKQGVSPVPARLSRIHTFHPLIALTHRRMTNGTPLGPRQTVRY